jgi:hypothetical protein
MKPYSLLTLFLLAAIGLNTSAIAQFKKQPKIEGCATPQQIIMAEAFNRGNEFKDAFVFKGDSAKFLSRWAGAFFPGTEPVVMVNYNDGSASVISFVGAPECWRDQAMERRK